MSIIRSKGSVSIVFLIFYDLRHDAGTNRIVEEDLLISVCSSLGLNALSLNKNRIGNLQMPEPEC